MMVTFRQLKNFYLLNKSSKQLLIESFVYLGVGRFLTYIPFSKVAPYLGKEKKETPANLLLQHQDAAVSIRHSIDRISHYTLWKSTCLAKAIAAMKMLEKRQIESTLYLGVARDKEGNMIAHAWLRSGSCYVTGAEEMQQFTPVGSFANFVHNKE